MERSEGPIRCIHLSGGHEVTYLISRLKSIVMHDDYKLRKKLLIYLLKYHQNEAQDNFPRIVRQYRKKYQAIILVNNKK
jgi:hypothetical protein